MTSAESTRRWFRIAYSGNALRRMLEEQGISVEGMTAAGGIRSMLQFMAQYRPQHGDQDELWCSWGPRDDVFEFAVSRRMHRNGHPPASVSIVLDYRSTPERMPLSGELLIERQRDAAGTVGYHALSGTKPRGCRIVQK